MMLYFDFLNKPVELQNGKISVLIIENKNCFRKAVQALMNGTAGEGSVVLSEKNQPIEYKTNAKLIENYFALECSSQQIKSIYTDMANYCSEEMREETMQLSQKICDYLERLNEAYDFDFRYDLELNLPELFKIKKLKPDRSCQSLVEALLDYMLLLQKYSSIKCFILLNLHSFFSTDELTALYKELLQRNMAVLVLESNAHYEACTQENRIIIDEDLCEIVADSSPIGL